MSSLIIPITFSLDELNNKSNVLYNTLHVIMFKADWCMPCKQIYSKIEELKINYPSVLFYKLNIDDNDRQDIVSLFNPTKVPSFYLYKKCDILAEHIGTNINKLEDLINKYL